MLTTPPERLEEASDVKSRAPQRAPRHWPALIGLVLVGLVLRLWGVTFGLPFEYHVDESLYNNVVRVLRSRGIDGLHPSFGTYHALLLAGIHGLEGVRGLLGRLVGSAEMAATLAAPGASLSLTGRTISATLGAATAIPVYFIGRRIWGHEVGMTAAAFLSVCFLHSRDSHYGTPDVTACFLAALAAYCSTLLSPRRGGLSYVLAGALAGLALATKLLVWPVMTLPLLFVLFGSARDPAAPGPDWAQARVWGKLALAYSSAGAAFMGASPQVLTKWGDTWNYWKVQAEVGRRGGMDRTQLDASGPVMGYLDSLQWGLGAPLMVLCILGVVWVLLKPENRQARLLMVFPVLYFGFLLLPGHVYFARFTLAALPFLLLAGAAALWRMRSRVPEAGRAWATRVALLILIAPTLVSTVRHDILLLRLDTRTEAKRWMEANVPDGSTIGLEFWWWGPQLSGLLAPIPLSDRSYKLYSKVAYGFSERSNTLGPSLGTPSVDDYADMGIEYLVSNSLMSESRLIDPGEEKAKRGFYRALASEAVLEKEFTPYTQEEAGGRFSFEECYGPAKSLWRRGRPGPVIRVYRLLGPHERREAAR